MTPDRPAACSLPAGTAWLPPMGAMASQTGPEPSSLQRLDRMLLPGPWEAAGGGKEEEREMEEEKVDAEGVRGAPLYSQGSQSRHLQGYKGGTGLGGLLGNTSSAT